MKARQEFVDAALNTSFKVFYKDFLTEEEMEAVIDGKDMWMGKDEVIARLQGTFNKKVVQKDCLIEAIEKAQAPTVTRRRGRPAKKA